MSLWHGTPSIEAIHARFAGTLPGLFGIRITAIAPDALHAEMPVDERHQQPAGLLHGGASVVLAETLGSAAAKLTQPPEVAVVGVDISATHMAAVRPGRPVSAVCRPLHLGRTMQVWQTEIRRADGKLACVSRLTVRILEGRGEG